MTQSVQTWRSQAEATLQEFIANPVTELEACGPDSEVSYLKCLGGTHIDTVARVGARLDALGIKKTRVLEMGAYFGVVSSALARGGVEVTAQDVSSMMNLPAQRQRLEKEGVTVMAVDDVSKSLPYPDASFDAIICCEMLEHLPFNTVPLIREMRRVLKPNGFAFLTVPNQASAKRRLQLLMGRPIRENVSSWVAAPQDSNWHWREWVASEFQELLLACGFNRVELGFRHFTPPAHPNPMRRFIVNLMYQLKPDLMDDIHVFAS
jgi:2-polyprenyl-3-methyl-5-hydroxy-6-metoxy-1,4-benzoquinol methylase